MKPEVIILSDEAFDEVVRILTTPSEPTESIKRGAEQLRRLYGNKENAR